MTTKTAWVALSQSAADRVYRVVLEIEKDYTSDRRSLKWGQGYLGNIERAGGGPFLPDRVAAAYVTRLGLEAVRVFALSSGFTVESLAAQVRTGNPDSCEDGGSELDVVGIRVHVKTAVSFRLDGLFTVKAINSSGEGVPLEADWYVFCRWDSGSLAVELIGAASRQQVSRAPLVTGMGRERVRQIREVDLIAIDRLPALWVG